MVAKLQRRGLDEMLRRVCFAYHVTLEDVLSRRRHARTVRARDACVFRLFEVPMSSPEVGALMGMDHSTALDARNRYAKRDGGRLIT